MAVVYLLERGRRMEGLKKKRLKRKNWKSGEISLYKAVDIKGKQRVEGGREIRAGWAGQKHFPKDKIFLFFSIVFFVCLSYLQNSFYSVKRVIIFLLAFFMTYQ